MPPVLTSQFTLFPSVEGDNFSYPTVARRLFGNLAHTHLER